MATHTQPNDQNGSASTGAVRKAIRKVIPVRASVFERRLNELVKKIESAQESAAQATSDLEASIEQSEAFRSESAQQQSDELRAIASSVAQTRETLKALADRMEAIEKKADELQTSQNAIQNALREQNSLLYRIDGLHRETLWAETFRQTIAKPAEWLTDPSFSPGRWAVGFPFLYALYRTLNEMKPKRILELGLGQTTKMISQYAAFYPDVEHHVVEHDRDWVEFWKTSSKYSERTHFHILELTETEHPSASHKVRCYQGFSDEFDGESFDFISVDAPFGYDMTDLARIDALSIIPQALAPSFAVMIDDYNRKGEQGMVKELDKQFRAASIEFKRGVYRGEKQAAIITSLDNSFLCSM